MPTEDFDDFELDIDRDEGDDWEDEPTGDDDW